MFFHVLFSLLLPHLSPDGCPLHPLCGLFGSLQLTLQLAEADQHLLLHLVCDTDRYLVFQPFLALSSSISQNSSTRQESPESSASSSVLDSDWTLLHEGPSKKGGGGSRRDGGDDLGLLKMAVYLFQHLG